MATGLINHFTTNSAKDPSWFVVFTWKKNFLNSVVEPRQSHELNIFTLVYVIEIFVSLCIQMLTL